jgi:TolA-binding protein
MIGNRITTLAKHTFLILMMAGCVTLGRYRDLEDRVDTLHAQNKVATDAGTQLAKELASLKSELEAQGLDLHRSDSGIEAQMERVQKGVRQLQGTDEEINFHLEKVKKQMAHIMKVLDDRFNISTEIIDEQLATDPATMLSQGDKNMNAAQYVKARSVFRSLISNHPQSEQAPKAQLRIGESYAREGKVDGAIREITTMEQKYADTPQMAEAYLLIGRLLEDGQCKKAIALYKYFLNRVPKHAERKNVKARIKTLEKQGNCK